MNERQKEIASQAIAEIVHEAVSGRDVPNEAELKQIAENAAKAIGAGFSALVAAVPRADAEVALFELMCDWCDEKRFAIDSSLSQEDRELLSVAARVRKTCALELKEVLRQNGLLPSILPRV